MNHFQTINKLIPLKVPAFNRNYAYLKHRTTDSCIAPILLIINVLSLSTLLQNTVAITALNIPAIIQSRDRDIHEIVRNNYDTEKNRQSPMPKYDQDFYQRPIATDDTITTSYANYLRSQGESAVQQTPSDLRNNLWTHSSTTNANEFITGTSNAAAQRYPHAYAPAAKTQKEGVVVDDVLVYPKGKFGKFNYAEKITISTDDVDNTHVYVKNSEGIDDVTTNQQRQKQQAHIFPSKIKNPVRLNYFTSGDAFARTYTLEDYGSSDNCQSSSYQIPSQQRNPNQELSHQLIQHNFDLEQTKRKKSSTIEEEKQEAAPSQLQMRIVDSNQNDVEPTSQLFYQHAQEITHADEHDTIESTQHILQHLQHQLHQQQQQFVELQQQLLLYTQQHSTSQPIQTNIHSTHPLPPITTRVHHTSESAAAMAEIPLRKHVHITKHIPVPHYQQVHVPYNQTVPIEIQRPVITAVPRPVAIHVPVHKTIAVPQINNVKIPIEKVKPYPVERPMPYIVERRVPYRLEKQVATPVYYPYPIKVPIIKTIVHKLPHNRGMPHLLSSAHLG